jgi:S1-C subfamily serine protease
VKTTESGEKNKGSLDVSDIAQAAMPAVVSITTKSLQEVQDYYGFFGYGYIPEYIEREVEGSGSGIIIGKNEEMLLIATNYHVIESEVDPEYEGYSRLYIKTSEDSETKIPAKVVGYDSVMDLALLKTEITPKYVFQLGSSENLEIGDQIYAIGSPLGLEKTITSGIISTTDRKITTMGTVMQIDASVNAGNSGGPAVSKEGLVQGVVFAGIEGSQGLNFAIPVEYLKNADIDIFTYNKALQKAIESHRIADDKKTLLRSMKK